MASPSMPNSPSCARTRCCGKLREFDSPQQPAMESAGKKLVNFSSNDYLGLATEPALREAAKAAIDQYGVGAGASRLVCGTLTPHVRLEERLAEFKRTEAALTFSSGYAAALGTLGALLRKDDVVILDKLCHASLIDGAKLSGAVMRVFPHNHLGKLESHLQWARETSSRSACDRRHGIGLQHGWRLGAAAGDRRSQESLRRAAAAR